MSRSLDIFKVPLDTVNLIEASAGTGKTYAIAGLYLRLLLERGHRVRDILVVTFTRAATEELKARIRARLFEARQAFKQGFSTDPLCRGLLDRCPDKTLGMRRLNNALLAFDEAAIFTIHGFCQRVLTDTAFASGTPFNLEIVADQSEFLQEIVEDFWRCRFYDAPPRWVRHLIEIKLTPEKLQAAVRPHLGKPYLKIAELDELEELPRIETLYETTFTSTRTLWLEQRQTVIDLFQQSRACLKKTSYPDDITAWYAELDDYFADTDALTIHCPKRFEYFTTAKLTAATKKGQTTPAHPFFDACQQLHNAAVTLQAGFERLLQRLHYELLTHCNQALPQRKRQLQVQSYDDLLSGLQAALAHPLRGPGLAERVRRRFAAALIDEFQDTDPIQYDIFATLYQNSGQALFLVGDPKQAIYSFRGADIFAYLRARGQGTAPYTLDVNWRSDPALLQAINTLFNRCPNPFLLDQIPFQTVQPAATDRAMLVTPEPQRAPLRLWFTGRSQDDGKAKRPSKEQTTAAVAAATAAEIARLLSAGVEGSAYLETPQGERQPLHGGHMAVLVRDHRQAQCIRTALLDVGVASVQHSRASVFATAEAQELERVLRAIAAPRQEALVRAALLTDLLGVGANELVQTLQLEQRWESILFEFGDYHELWRSRGFIQMFRALLTRRDVYRRLLGFSDGERRLTNLLHLGELLQGASLGGQRGMNGVVKWLALQRQNPNGDDETQQLRLESDARLVQIVTVHKSKGLEYPIVFCPFLWDAKGQSQHQKIILFHDPEADFQPVLDLGSPQQDQGRPHAARETLAEDLRLAYVALTRAKFRCYTVWGPINTSEKSALAWLLHKTTATQADEAALEDHWEYVKDLDDNAMQSDLYGLAAAAEGQIHISPLPTETSTAYRSPEHAPPTLAARQFYGQTRIGRRFTSFTALHQRHSLEELPDHDAVTGQPLPSRDQTRSIYSFPRGTRAGRCLHRIFEHIDFRASRADIATLVQQQLTDYGFETEWTPVVVAMVEAVCHTPLDASGKLTLARVPTHQRLDELDFLFPFEQLDIEYVRRLVHLLGGEMYREAPLAALDSKLLEGFMRGFIDLVFEFDGRFYVVDYKSNWLGPELSDYGPERIEAAMAAGSYHLQYLIYTVAVHRYLRWRQPGYRYEQHFGGVRYLFLRGIQPQLGLNGGIFADRPPPPLIAALDDYLATGHAHHG